RNMPLPSSRPGMNPAVRQVSAQAMYPPGGMCPDGACSPMMGQGACGPMMGPGACSPMMGQGACGPEGGAEMGAPMGFVPQAYGRGPSYENPAMPGYA